MSEDHVSDSELDQQSFYDEKTKNFYIYLMRSGRRFIRMFMQLLKKTNASQDTKQKYMPKVLHAIFFFGQINDPPIDPTRFIPDPEMHEGLQKLYPAPFAQCKTHLPTQAPYSVLLDYVTEELKEEDVINYLYRINSQLWRCSPTKQKLLQEKEFFFSAHVVACSYDASSEAKSRHFYGASLSCRGREAKRVMIALSCIATWHKAVAYAVYHGAKGPAIVFPGNVWCCATKFTDNNKVCQMPPCAKCHKIFQKVNFDPPIRNNPSENKFWEYGNCAETESLSKLLAGISAMEEGIQSTRKPPRHSYAAMLDEFRRAIEPVVQNRLMKMLREKGFEVDSLQFFDSVGQTEG